MRSLGFSKNLCRFFLFFAAALMLVPGPVALSLGYADEKSGDTEPNNRAKAHKIHITANRLISDNDADYAEFIGDVKATQGDTVITADRLKIFYKATAGQKDTTHAIGKESITKIVADGNVKIYFNNRVAVTPKAVYNTKTRTLVLLGSSSKIVSGDNSISGEKITIDRVTGRINVESGDKKRVEAVLYSGEKGLIK